MNLSGPDDDVHLSIQRLQEMFELKILEVIRGNLSRGISLHDRGDIRIALQRDLDDILNKVDVQIDEKYMAFELLLDFGEKVFDLGETDLCLRCSEFASVHFTDQITNKFNKVVANAMIVYCTALCERKNILHHTSNFSHISPRMVSQMLDVANTVEDSLTSLFDNFNNTELEKVSHIVLNKVKFLYHLLQPLIWWNCGKYVTKSLLFAAVCMESIINLCTVKHVNLRLKLYASALYSALANSGSPEEINSIVSHAFEQFHELKEREDMNPLITSECEQILRSFRDDVLVMKQLANFFADPTSFSVGEFMKDLTVDNTGDNVTYLQGMREKLFVECCRAQQITSCNMNEMWRRRSSTLIEAASKHIDDSGIENISFSSQTLLQIYALTVFDGPCLPVPESLRTTLQMTITDLIEHRITNFDKGVNHRIDIAVDNKKNVEDTGDDRINTVDNAEKKGVFMHNDFEKASNNLDDKWDTNEPIRRELKILQIVVELSNLYFKKHDENFMSRKDNENEFEYDNNDVELWNNKESGNQLMDELHISLSLLQNIEEFLHSNYTMKRKCFLQKISLNIWKRYLCPTLKEILSLKAYSKDKIHHRLNAMVPSLIATFRSFLGTSIEDPMLIASIGSITVLSLREMEKLREAISIAKRTIDVVDEYRAARVDTSVHLPEDILDIQSIQRAALSVKRESFDWYHSFKRLGASAYAGFGLFGASSSGDMMDIHLAEIHTNLLSMYFRSEIEYGILQVNFKESESSKFFRDGKKRRLLRTSDATKLARKRSMDIEKLSCITYLRRYCQKNLYQKCVLCLEMARAENDGEKVVKHLQQGLDYIEDIERTEEKLLQDFNRLTLRSKDAASSPVILSRSHRFIVVAPVVSSAIENCYCTILAREEGSGTFLKESDNGLGGSEIRKSVHDLITPAKAGVKLLNLVPGERYIFASAVVDGNSGHIQNISSASVAVEALNPLPTILLWYDLSNVAFKRHVNGIGLIASSRVVQIFIPTPPKPEALCLGRGININYGEQSIVAMSAIDKTSSLIVHCFVQSFIKMHSIAHDRAIFDKNTIHLHWDQNKKSQITSLNLLRNIGMVVSLAASSMLWKSVIQGICIGYEILSALLLYDELSLSSYLHKPIVLLLVGLQSIPKHLWNDLEHFIYNRLLFHGLRCALVASSTSAYLELLSKFHEAEMDGCSDAVSSDTLSIEVLENYRVSICSFDILKKVDDLIGEQVSNLFHTNTLISSLGSEPEKLWDHSFSSQVVLCRGRSYSLLAENVDETTALIQKGLKSIPSKYSKFLKLLLFIACDKSSNFPVDRTISTKEQVYLLFEKFPVYACFLCPKVKSFNDLWNLKFVKNTDSVVDEGELSQKGELEELSSKDVSREEIHEEMGILGSLCLLYATSEYEGLFDRNLYPSELFHGPDEFLDPMSRRESFHINGTHPITVEARKLQYIEAAMDFSVNDYIFHIYAAIVLFDRGNLSISSIDTCIQLWNFVMRKWIDPWEFCEQFKSLKSFFLDAVMSLVHSVENLVQYQSLKGEGVDYSCLSGNEETVVYEYSVPMKRRKEYLFLAKSPLKYFMKVLWTYGEYSSVVNAGTRIIAVYIDNLYESMKDIGNHIFPLIIESQNILLSGENLLIKKQREELENYIKDFMDLRTKKNRKKLRITRIEKSDEEIKFESDKNALEEKVQKSVLSLRNLQIELDHINDTKRRFDSVFSSGAQLLKKVRIVANAFVKKCLESTKIRKGPDLISSLDDVNIHYEFDSIVDQFDQVASILREKKDCLTLLECLKCQGDILIAFGSTQKAQRVWLDAIDGLFNTFDCCKYWQTVVEKASKRSDYELTHGCLPVISILGCLSKFCANVDWYMKSTYCRMAAKLCMIPFSQSISFPSFPHAFAAYICTELGGIAALNYDDDRLSLSDLTISLEEVVFVLTHQHYFIDALPVFVLLEHIYACYLQKSDAWLRVRLLRVHTLINLHFFSEAVSMLTGIQTSLISIETGIYTNTSVEAVVLEQLNSTKENQEELSNDENGLNYYGENIKFLNNLPPDSQLNRVALEWINALPSRLSEFMDTFVTRTPIPHTEHDKTDHSDIKDATDFLEEKKVRLCSPQLYALVDHVCGAFLAEVSYLNLEHTSENFHFFQELSSKAEALINSCMKNLTGIYCGNLSSIPKNDTEAAWITLFGGACIHKCKLFLHRREYKRARASLILLLKRIKTGFLLPDLRVVYTYLWFECRYYLSCIAQEQGRIEDALRIVQHGLDDSSAMFHAFYTKKFLYLRALLNYYLGNILLAELEVNKSIEMYETGEKASDSLVWCYLLKISIIRSKYCIDNDKKVSDYNLKLCIDLCRRAVDLAKSTVKNKGFIGADINASFLQSDVTSTILGNEVYSPFEHNLSENMKNSLDHSFGIYIGDAKHIRWVCKSDHTTTNYEEKTHRKIVRPAPIDEVDFYVCSSYANIYIEGVNLLSRCHGTLCNLLHESRLHMESLQLLEEQIVVGEEGLKLLRYVYKADASVRTMLLLSVGRTRQAVRKGILDPGTCFIDGVEYPIFPRDEYMEAFKTAFLIASRRGDLWDLVRCASLEIFECNFDTVNPSSRKIQGEAREATLYLNLCIETIHKKNNLMKKTVQLSHEIISVTESLSGILQHLVQRIFGINDTAKKTDFEDDVDGYSARDALYLARMLVQECDNLLNFSHVPSSLKQDMHISLKNSHEIYNAACCKTVSGMFIDNSLSSIIRNSVSTMLTNNFANSTSLAVSNSMILYMILGGCDESESNTPLQFPAVTKFFVSRNKISSLELTLMELRSLLADSSFWNSNVLKEQAGKKFQILIEEIFIILGTCMENDLLISVDYGFGLENPILLIRTSLGQSVRLNLNDVNLTILSEIFSLTKECVRDAMSLELWSLFSLIVRKSNH